MASKEILNAFPDVFDSPVPAFNSEGCLPPGDFSASRAEFESRFVETGDRERRVSIYRGWNRHRLALLQAGLPGPTHQLLNGSYTTAKATPGDIDIAVEVPVRDGGAMASLTPDHAIVRLLLGPAMKPGYSCDAYPLYSLPPDDPLYLTVTVGAMRYWTKWFGRSRTGQSKGRLWATTEGLQ